MAGARELADSKAQEARDALAERSLGPSVQSEVFYDGGFEGWAARNATPIVVLKPRLPGDWYLKLEWQYFPTPGLDDASLLYASISLNVGGITATTEIGTDCLVRYDIERRPGSRLGISNGAHLNVLQPRTLDDRAHYPMFGAADEWPLADVLDFLLSEGLDNDLEGHLIAA